MSLTEKLNLLITDEDLNSEKMESAFEDLLPKVSDYLNRLEEYLIESCEEGVHSADDICEKLYDLLDKLREN